MEAFRWIFSSWRDIILLLSWSMAARPSGNAMEMSMVSGAQPLEGGVVAGNGENYSSLTNPTVLLAQVDGRHKWVEEGGKKTVAYVDIGYGESKKHVVLLMYDGVEEVRRLNSLLPLLNLHIQTVFIGSLMFKVIPEVKALTEREVKVFYLQTLNY